MESGGGGGGGGEGERVGEERWGAEGGRREEEREGERGEREISRSLCFPSFPARCALVQLVTMGWGSSGSQQQWRGKLRRGWVDYNAKGRKPPAQETSGEAEGWKTVGRKKAAAFVVAKTAAAVAKSEAKAEQAEETEAQSRRLVSGAPF